MILEFLSLVLVLCASAVKGSANSPIFQRPLEPLGFPTKYDYRQSLKKPFALNPAMKTSEKTASYNIPHWKASGYAHPVEDRVRLAPNAPEVQGAIWCTEPNPHKEWIATFSFKVSSPPSNNPSVNSGGEGLGIFYAKDPHQSGPIYGSKDLWQGLLIGMDSSLPGRRYVPLIYGYVNEYGTQAFNGYQKSPDANRVGFLGQCYRDYRNSPHRVYGRLSYVGKTLKLEMDLNQDGNAFSECFSKSNVDLPIGYHFGVSAATQKVLHDDHDLFSFEVSEVNPSGKKGQEEREGLPINKEDLQKIKEVTELVDKIEETENQSSLPTGFSQEFGLPQIQILVQNQEKMINSINLLTEKFGMAPILAARLANHHFDRLTDMHMSRLGSETEDLERRIDKMMDVASSASKNVKMLIESVTATIALGDSTLKGLAEALERQNSQLESTVQLATVVQGTKKRGGGSWKMFLAFFVVGGLVVVAVRSAMRSSNTRSSGGLGYH
ncbi:Protein ERGIC-53 [Rhizoclosmatium sp. JEL0117]|nr:Protein ERGIC-53 [Rhizoclosmatium sp. JEL0117]